MSAPTIAGAGPGAGIGGDPDAVDLGADGVHRGGQRVDDAGDDVRQHANDVVARWTGSTADAAHESLRLYAQRASVAGESIAAAKRSLGVYATALRNAKKKYADALAAQQEALQSREDGAATLAALPPVGHRGPGEEQIAAAVNQTGALDDAVDGMASAVAAEALANQIAADAITALVSAVDEATALTLTADGAAPTLAQAREAVQGPEPEVVSSTTVTDTITAGVSFPAGPAGVVLNIDGDGSAALVRSTTEQADGGVQIGLGIAGGEGLGVSAGKTLPGGEIEAKGGAKVTTGAGLMLNYDFSSDAESDAFMKEYGTPEGYARLVAGIAAGTIRPPDSTTTRATLGVEADATVGVDGAGEVHAQGSQELGVESTAYPDGRNDLSVSLSATSAGEIGLDKIPSLGGEATVGAALGVSLTADGRPTAVTLTLSAAASAATAKELGPGWLKQEGSVSEGLTYDRTYTIPVAAPGEPDVASDLADAVASGDPERISRAGDAVVEAARSVEPEVSWHRTKGEETTTTLEGGVFSGSYSHSEDSSTLVGAPS